MGVVSVDGVNINESILKAGYAWQYGKYCKKKFCKDWLKYQNKAKAAKKGLWRDKQPTAPWDWRKAKRNKKSSKKSSATSGEFHGNASRMYFTGPPAGTITVKIVLRGSAVGLKR